MDELIIKAAWFDCLSTQMLEREKLRQALAQSEGAAKKAAADYTASLDAIARLEAELAVMRAAAPPA